MVEKCLVLYSGGLDSRLAIKLMQEKGYEVIALNFVLPFGCSCCDESFPISVGAKLVKLNVCRGKLLDNYLSSLKNAKHGRGSGYNPCKDCKLWMFNEAKKYANKKNISLLASGEVLGQRPMSQTKKALDLIDESLNFKIVRPLIELGICGRRRVEQMKLADKLGIKYPFSGGGCLLCEKFLSKRFKFLIDKSIINEKTLTLSKIGKHFFIDGVWFIVARNEEESNLIEKHKNVLKSNKRTPAVYFSDSFGKDNALKLQIAFKNRLNSEFEKYKI